jgi:hypothetical protein
MSVDSFLVQDKIFVHHPIIRPNFIFKYSHTTENFESRNRYAEIVSILDAPTSLIMQVAGSGMMWFSYNIFWSKRTSNRKGFLRFGIDIPHNLHYVTTKILPALKHLEFGYHVNLIGINMGALKLEKIHLEMFVHSNDGKAGVWWTLQHHLQ